MEHSHETVHISERGEASLESCCAKKKTSRDSVLCKIAHLTAHQVAACVKFKDVKQPLPD